MSRFILIQIFIISSYDSLPTPYYDDHGKYFVEMCVLGYYSSDNWEKGTTRQEVTEDESDGMTDEKEGQTWPIWGCLNAGY